MAMAHHQQLYGHGFMSCSTSSLPSTPVTPNYRESCPSKHIYSSPLAECYAEDADLGIDSKRRYGSSFTKLAEAVTPPIVVSSSSRVQNDECPKSFSDLSPTKDTITQESPNPLSRKLKGGQIPSSKLCKTLVDAPMHAPPNDQLKPSAPRMPYPSATNRSTVEKPLLSPITFNAITEPSDASDSTEDGSYGLEPDKKPTTDIPTIGASENRCAFPQYEDYTVPSDTIQDATQATSWSTPRIDISTRRRSMSLGDNCGSTSPGKQELDRGNPRSLLARRRATAGSKELRRSAGSLSLKKDCAPWVDQIVKATKRVGFYQSYGSVNGSNSIAHGRPRLWLDATHKDQGTAEAHIMAVTPSPTKPRVISISRRCSSGTPPKQVSPVAWDSQLLWSRSKPVTPPETPQGSIALGKSSSGTGVQGHTASRAWQVRYPYTPPNSRVSTPRARSTVRRITSLPSGDPRLRPSPPSNPPLGPCSSRVDLIMGELEATVNNYPTARLYLDSPVVQYIRLSRSSDSVSLQSPSTPWSTAPHSRYSVFKSLSSHPVTPQATPTYGDVQFRGIAPETGVSSMQPSSQVSTQSPLPDSRPTMSALRIIFPQAPAALLDSLHATYLALNYISSLPTSPSTPSEHPSTLSSKSSIRSFSSIPPKAMATLGIQTPHLSVKRTSWLRSTPPSAEGDTSSVNENMTALVERRQNVQISLRILVRGLLGEIEGRRLTKRDESLVRAVGEVVRCGEAVSPRLTM